MKGLLLSLSLVALFALCAQSDIPVQPDFQNDKIIGKWYSIAVAYNCSWFQSYKHLMNMSTTVITPTGDGNLEGKFTFPTSNRCQENTMRYFKTDQPGRFRATMIRSGEDYDMRIVETNYEEYALMSMRNTNGTDVHTTVTLLGRGKELRPELLAKFRNFSLEHGFGEDNIIILPQTGQCMTEA